MKEKPKDSILSDTAWERFYLFGESIGLGWDHEDDWKIFYDAYKIGYVTGVMEERNGQTKSTQVPNRG